MLFICFINTSWTSLVGSTGLSSYHGILPKLTRKWIHGLVDNSIDAPGGSMNQQFTTALLSFLYHLACYEENVGPGNTQNATLNSSGVLDTMLQLISWHTSRNDYLSYVTRAVRVTDQILMSIPFSRQNVVAILVDRLRFEVELVLNSASEARDPTASCPLLNTQRSGLMKSILNLLKRLCLDTEWGEVMHSVMEGTLPDILRQIFLNGFTHFTPHLALFAMESITNYLYTYPSRISTMQDKNVTTDILTALARQPLPQNRDFLVQLPGLFNTLSLNARGIEAVQNSGVLNQYLETLVSPEYLGTMKTKRVRDFLSQIPYNLTSSTGQSLSNSLTASQMSNAIQELLRSRSELKPTVFQSLVSCLRRVVELGRMQPASLIVETACPGTSIVHCSDTDQKASQSSSRTASCQHLDTSLPCLTGCALASACCSSSAAANMEVEETSRSGMMLDDDVVMLSGGEEEDDDDDNDIDDLTRATQAHSATRPSRNLTRMDSRSASPAPSLSLRSNESRPTDIKAPVSQDGSPVSPYTFLPDFMLNTCKFLEKLLPSVLHVTEAMCRHFMSHGGLQVLCDLLCMPGLPYDFPVSAACASLCKIFEDLANSIYLNDVIDPLFQCLESSLEKLTFLQNSQPTMSSVLLHEYVSGEHTLLHELVVTASIICIMVQIIDHLKPELRPSLANKWIGRNMLQTLGRLYVSVSWEASILLKLLFGDKDITEFDMQLPSRDVTSDGAPSETLSACKPVSTFASDATSSFKPVTETTPLPQFVEALHIYSLLKPSKPPVDDNKNAFLHHRPDLTKATHRILHVTAFLINSFTELCTAWERFFANRNQSTYRRRRMTLLPCEQIPSSTKYAALSQISHVLSDTLAWEASSSVRCHPAAPGLICAMRYAAIRLTNNLMLGSNQKGLQGGLLNAFLAVNGVRRYFGLFHELLSFDLTDPNVREPLAVVLEEWLACADRLSNADNASNDISRTPESEISVVHATNHLEFVHQHMLFSLEQLCIRNDLQSLLTKAAVEHLLSMLISVVPYLFNTGIKVQPTEVTAAALESLPGIPSATTTTTAQSSDASRAPNTTNEAGHSISTVDPRLSINNTAAWSLPSEDTLRPTVALCNRPDSPVPTPVLAELPSGDSVTAPAPQPMDTSESEQSESESDPRGASALLLLEEMGFSRQLATVALEQTGWNTNEAVNLLIATPEQELLSNVSRPIPLPRHTTGWMAFPRNRSTRQRDVADQANPTDDDSAIDRSVSAIATAAMQVASAASSFIATTGNTIDHDDSTSARTTNPGDPRSVPRATPTPSTGIPTSNSNEPPILPVELETPAPEVIGALRESLKQHVFRACYTIAERHHSDQILHRIAELLLSSGEEDRYIDELFGFVASTISERLGVTATPRLPSSFPGCSEVKNPAPTVTTVKEHPTVGLHLSALLFTRCHSMCARLAWAHNFPHLLVSWISHLASKGFHSGSPSVEECREISAGDGVDCYKTLLLASLILDQYLRSVQAMQLRQHSAKRYAHSHSWNWFDDRAMLWHPYTTESGRIIDTAFHRGDTCAFCHISRKPYAIEFPTMTQVNLDSMHRRPVMLFPTMSDDANGSQEKENNAISAYEKGVCDGEIPPDLTPDQQKTLSSALLDLFKSSFEMKPQASIPSDCANAMLRLLLRLAYSSYDNSRDMLDKGILSILLNVPHTRGFTAEYSAFVGALLTQVFDDVQTVSHVMKDVFTKMCQFGVPSTFMGIGATSTTCRDLFYLLGMCVPMFAKDRALAHKLALETIRLSLTDADILAKTVPKSYLVEVPKSPANDRTKFMLSEHQQRLLTILIESISSPPVGKEASHLSVGPKAPNESNEIPSNTGIRTCVTQCTSALNTPIPSTPSAETSTGDYRQRLASDPQNLSSNPTIATPSFSDTSTSRESVVLGKADSIRFLIDLVASYQAVAEFIAFYGRKVHSASIDHGHLSPPSFLSHLFTYELGQSDTTELATTLLENLMLVGSDSTQDAVIGELKASLSRISSSATNASSVQRTSASQQPDAMQLRKNDRLIAHMMFLERLLALPPVFVDRVTRLIYRRHLPGDIAKLIAVTDCNLPNTQSTFSILLRTLESLTWVDRQLTRSVWSGRDRRSDATSGVHSAQHIEQTRSPRGHAESNFSYIDSAGHGDASAQSRSSGYLPPADRDSSSYRSMDARHFDSDSDDDDDDDNHDDFPLRSSRAVADDGIANLSEPTAGNASLNLVLDDVLMSGADIVLEQPHTENRDVTQPWHSADDQEGSMIFVHDDEDEGSAGQGGEGGNSQDEDDDDEDEGEDDEDDGEADDDDEDGEDDDLEDEDEEDDDVGGETDEEIIADDGEVALVLRSGSSGRRLHNNRRPRPEATVSVSVTTVRTSDEHEPAGNAGESSRAGYQRASENIHDSHDDGDGSFDNEELDVFENNDDDGGGLQMLGEDTNSATMFLTTDEHALRDNHPVVAMVEEVLNMVDVPTQGASTVGSRLAGGRRERFVIAPSEFGGINLIPSTGAGGNWGLIMPRFRGSDSQIRNASSNGIGLPPNTTVFRFGLGNGSGASVFVTDGNNNRFGGVNLVTSSSGLGNFGSSQTLATPMLSSQHPLLQVPSNSSTVGNAAPSVSAGGVRLSRMVVANASTPFSRLNSALPPMPPVSSTTSTYQGQRNRVTSSFIGPVLVGNSGVRQRGPPTRLYAPFTTDSVGYRPYSPGIESGNNPSPGIRTGTCSGGDLPRDNRAGPEADALVWSMLASLAEDQPSSVNSALASAIFSQVEPSGNGNRSTGSGSGPTTSQLATYAGYALPASYRRWITLSRMLFGHELMDLILISRCDVYQELSKLRQESFKERLLEAEKSTCSQTETTTGSAEALAQPTTQSEPIPTDTVPSVLESTQDTTVPVPCSTSESQPENHEQLDPHPSPVVPPYSDDANITSTGHVDLPRPLDETDAGAVSEPATEATSQPSVQPASVVAPAPMTDEETIQSLVEGGMDPSFLDALPEEMRREVIADHRHARQVQQQLSSLSLPEHVNTDWLVGLPTHIQEEVLTQFRQEQQHLLQQPAPVDSTVVSGDESTRVVDVVASSRAGESNTAFLVSLPTSLRREVLADMDESQLDTLPPDLAAEARQLRRENEERFARVVQGNMLTHSFSSRHDQDIWRNLTSATGLIGGPGRWDVRFNSINQFLRHINSAFGGRPCGNTLVGSQSLPAIRGRHMMDHEALTCLVALLIASSTCSQQRRHVVPILRKVLRNLSCHLATRNWIIGTLLSLFEGLSEKPDKDASESHLQQIAESDHSAMPNPTNTIFHLGFEAALGCWVRVFHPVSVSSAPCPMDTDNANRRSSKDRPSVSGIERPAYPSSRGSLSCRRYIIHPQAAVCVSSVLLETLSELARAFPSQFYPRSLSDRSDESSLSESPPPIEWPTPIFWELFERLSDSLTPSISSSQPKSGRRGHGSAKKRDSSNLNKPLSDSSQVPLGILTDLNPEHPSGIVPMDVTSSDASPCAQSTSLHPLRRSTGSVAGVEYFVHLSNLLCHPLVQDRTSHQERILTILAGIIKEFISNRVSAAGALAPSTGAAESGETLVRGDEPESAPSSNDVPTVSAGSVGEPPGRVEVPKEHPHSEAPSSIDLVAPLRTEVVKMLCQFVLAPKSTESGRNMAAQLITDLARANRVTKDFMLRLLSESADQLTKKLCSQLQDLMDEIASSSSAVTSPTATPGPSTSSWVQPSRSGSLDVLPDRFGGSGQYVVISGESRPDAPTGFSELHLKSVQPLSCPNNDQSRLRGILGLIVRLAAGESSISATDPVLVSSHDPSESIPSLRDFWPRVSAAFEQLQTISDPNSVLLLQPLLEAFCLAHLFLVKDSIMIRQRSITSRSNRTNPTAANTGTHSLIDMVPTLQLRVEPPVLSTDRPETTGPSASEQTTHLHVDIMGPMSPSAPIEEDKTAGDAPYRRTSVVSSSSSGNPILQFAEQHRSGLNQVLRQNSSNLGESPFAVFLVYSKVLDFDIKRRFFRQQLQSLSPRSNMSNRYDDEPIVISRDRIFEDSYARLHRRSASEWKHKFVIRFQNEEGQDAGGPLREWYLLMSREIFNPNYCLFRTSPADRVTYTINPSSYINSNHLSYFKFVGRFIAKAIYDNKLLECYFSRSFYKHILGVPVKCSDLESDDYEFYKGLEFLLKNHISDLGYELTFSTEISEFGKTETRDLIEDGRNVHVTEQNKREYVRLVCQERMTGAIRQQLDAFLGGFYEIIPKRMISIFNEQELELLISGLPNIDITDLKANTTYSKYQSNSPQIEWFWSALESLDQEDRARFLQFVTGTSKVPLGGFANLEGMHGPTKFQISRASVSSTSHLPCAHTCFNTLVLPAYETYDQLRSRLLIAIRECSEGYGMA
ncbi:unnamed protein product [Dicrocoelium dendriticum]|nr:unnamed protein product [Dicrocoelium dendriticum]